VREGDHVAKDQPIAQLDTRRLKLEMETTEQEKLRYMADADRSRATGDEAAAQVSLLQVKVLDQQEKKIQADIESATLRSTIDGVVMTKDLELRAGEVLQQGVSFAEIAGANAWDLHAEVNERDIGLVEKALSEKGALDLNYILYSQSAHVLHARIDNRQQISASAFPKEKENVFVITVHNPPIPAEISKNLRPGLTGRAKLELGRRPLIFTFAQKIYRWFQYRMIG
jgi:multidrug efflux pump subunit AcrA (membrane-fusion protein)